MGKPRGFVKLTIVAFITVKAYVNGMQSQIGYSLAMVLGSCKSCVCEALSVSRRAAEILAQV